MPEKGQQPSLPSTSWIDQKRGRAVVLITNLWKVLPTVIQAQEHHDTVSVHYYYEWKKGYNQC